MNRRGLFSLADHEDVFKKRGLLSPQKWEMSPKGQHFELGIAEMNLFLMLAALGLSHSLFGERLLPVGTLYDPFVCRGLDALNYACYQDARFIVAGTPSGITLAPEGGAHQSIGTPLIGMAQDGLASFEPAYVDELATIMEWAFDYMQRGGDEDKEKRWHRDEKGGSVYLRLSTRPIDQPHARHDRRPARQRSSTAAIGCAGRSPAPTSPSSTPARWRRRRSRRPACCRRTGAASACWPSPRPTGCRPAGTRRNGRASTATPARAPTSRRCWPPCRAMPAIITLTDAYPEALSWIGGVCGHRVRALGVEHFGQSGSLSELYGHYGLDVNAILTAAEGHDRTAGALSVPAEVGCHPGISRQRNIRDRSRACVACDPGSRLSRYARRPG